MDTAVNYEKAMILREQEENQKKVREIVLDSYQDMLDGKGKNSKDFFADLESRYKNAKV